MKKSLLVRHNNRVTQGAKRFSNRLERPLALTSLAGATLAGATLARVTLAGMTLARATLAGMTLARATLAGMTLARMTLAGSAATTASHGAGNNAFFQASQAKSGNL